MVIVLFNRSGPEAPGCAWAMALTSLQVVRIHPALLPMRTPPNDLHSVATTSTYFSTRGRVSENVDHLGSIFD